MLESDHTSTIMFQQLLKLGVDGPFSSSFRVDDQSAICVASLLSYQTGTADITTSDLGGLDDWNLGSCLSALHLITSCILLLLLIYAQTPLPWQKHVKQHLIIKSVL